MKIEEFNRNIIDISIFFCFESDRRSSLKIVKQFNTTFTGNLCAMPEHIFQNYTTWSNNENEKNHADGMESV